MDNLEKESVEHEYESRREKKRYVYVDNSTNEHLVIFECIANDILEADENYKRVVGKDVPPLLRPPHASEYQTRICG